MATIETLENREGSGWLRLRGLPFSASIEDVISFMEEAAVVTEWDAAIKYGTDGRPSGEAYVQVDSRETAEEAIKILDRKHMGSRFIEVFMSNYDDSQQTRHNGGKGFDRDGPYGSKDWGNDWGSSSYDKGSSYGKGGGYGKSSYGKGGKGKW